ncbi:MAG: endo alpha-1,4 polygalactosaminidase [Deltaproteobacteria bacterium]|nr:endo alpha-1,4 polygalactosaminidase [Deltaproteobacteria bacterium]
MRLAVLGLATLLVGACDNGKHHLHPEAGRDAPPPPWWQPELGTAKDWDIQLAPPYDVSATRTMYVVDLWDFTPATMIDYGDGDPVTVPAGPQAGKIAELKARGVKVICHVDTGALHLLDPDARKFPGYAATVPDRETPPAASIGWSVTSDDPDERYLDIRTATRGAWTSKMWKRLDLAKQIGCDGVDGDRNDSISADPPYSGFKIEVSDQISWYKEVAKQLHMRELSAGMRNGNYVPSLVDEVSADFDWMIVERCGELMDCDSTRPFVNKRRVVFAIDYVKDLGGDPNTEGSICNRQQAAQISEGLIKDFPPTSAKRTQCQP